MHCGFTGLVNETDGQAEGPNDITELYLPGPNEFIPTNLDVEKRDVPEVMSFLCLPMFPDCLTVVVDSQPAKRPHLIKQTPLGSVWHKKDDQFWLPKASVVLELRRYVLGLTRIRRLVLIIYIVQLQARLRVLTL